MAGAPGRPSNHPIWSRIILAGHSQGGGVAFFAGRDRQLAGSIDLGAFDMVVTDASIPTFRPAAWTAEPGQTDPAHHTVLLHHADFFDFTSGSVDNLAVPGTYVDVDSGAPPFECTSRLVSDLARDPATVTGDPREDAHNALAKDGATPRVLDEDGVTMRPVLAPAWRYLFVRAASPAMRAKITLPANARA